MGGCWFAHGNLGPHRMRGGLGEVCFLLDPENIFLPLLVSHSSPLSFHHVCDEQKNGALEESEFILDN